MTLLQNNAIGSLFPPLFAHTSLETFSISSTNFYGNHNFLTVSYVLAFFYVFQFCTSKRAVIRTNLLHLLGQQLETLIHPAHPDSALERLIIIQTNPHTPSRYSTNNEYQP